MYPEYRVEERLFVWYPLHKRPRPLPTIMAETDDWLPAYFSRLVSSAREAWVPERPFFRRLFRCRLHSAVSRRQFTLTRTAATAAWLRGCALGLVRGAAVGLCAMFQQHVETLSTAYRPHSRGSEVYTSTLSRLRFAPRSC